MYAYYNRLIRRNQGSGRCYFYVNPGEPCSFAKDGLIKCYGRIGIYEEKTPLILNGLYDDKKELFIVDSADYPKDSDKAIEMLLEYVEEDLTEGQIERLTEVMKPDAFLFAEKIDAEGLIMKALKSRNSKKNAELSKKILQTICKFKEQESVTKELMALDVPLDRIEVLYRKEISIEKIKEDPYRIFTAYDISILSAEKLAMKQEWFDEYDIRRLKGFVLDSMNRLTQNGDTCVSPERLLRIVNFNFKQNGLYPTELNKYLLHLCVTQLEGSVSYHTVGNQTWIYKDRIWEEESTAISDILRLQAEKKDIRSWKDISEIEKKLRITYNEGQRAALKAVETSGVKILTGPPGSGKTATIKGMIQYFYLPESVRLAATTGRASRVMGQACGLKAETVNKMLQVRPFEGKNINSMDVDNPIQEKLVIVDEVSMLGVQLLSYLLAAVQSGTCLILGGDEDQLQSVEYGNVLHDLIESGKIEVYRLTEVMRQSGTICENAAYINHGESGKLIRDETFEVETCVDEKDMIDTLRQQYKSGDSQILCPVKKGIVSTESLNKWMEDTSREVMMNYGKKVFRKDDKVIMTRTDYDAGYMNGDIGYVKGVKDEMLIVKFDDRILYLDRQGIHDVEHADVVTIHKSQGSEFGRIYICLPAGAEHMMTRRLIYTAVTRAKKKVIVYTVEDLLQKAISNIKEKKRDSLLGYRLKNS